MPETFPKHPLMMNDDERIFLPETTWHPKIQDRYPLGSSVELSRRAQALFYRHLARLNDNLEVLTSPPMQPRRELLETISSTAVDIVAPALILELGETQKTILIMEDHFQQDERTYTMGKSTIVQKLIGLSAVADDLRRMLKIAPGEKVSPKELIAKMAEKEFGYSTVDMAQQPETNAKLLTGDVTFIARSQEGRIVALPTVGTKEDFIFDVSRTAMRFIIKDYNRKDDDIMKAQLKLAEKIRVPNSIWAKTDVAYPIDEIIFLTLDPAMSKSALWGKEFTDRESVISELQNQLLQNPLYLNDEITYWNVDPKSHAKAVIGLFDEKLIDLPAVRYLALNNPKNPDVLESATDLIRGKYEI